MMRSLLFVSFGLFALVVPCASDAQVIEAPPRSAGGQFGGRQAGSSRTEQTLSATVSVLGGYEDNFAPDLVVHDAFAPGQSGATGSLSSDLFYRVSQQASSLEASVGADLNTFRTLDLASLVGGEASMRAATRIKNTDVFGAVMTAYRPTLTLHGGGALESDGTAAPVDSTSGVSEVSSQTFSEIISATHHWSVRHFTTVTAMHGVSDYSTGGVDSRTLQGSLGHQWSATRNVGVRFDYALLDVRTTEPTGEERPLDTHNLSIGLSVRRRLTRTKTLVLTGGPAASAVKTVRAIDHSPLEYIAPSGFASVRLDIGRSWSLAVDWRREASVLDGLTPQTFLTNNAGLSIGGDLPLGLRLAANGSFMNGLPHAGDEGSYQAISGIVQLERELSRCCSIVGHYTYSHHVMHQIEDVPSGFPLDYERNAVRIGMTLRLPLYSSARTGRAQNGQE